ncbi:nitronate monooxygenase [Streptomyces sp. NPDC003758]
MPDLLSAVRREVSVPLVAAGGIATPDTVAEALATGAVAVMVGTVLVRTPGPRPPTGPRSLTRHAVRLW